MKSISDSNSALLIAFHFPPLQGSSGIQRTLGFARYLPDHDWRPVVLAPGAFAYPQVDDKQMELIPDGLRVERAFCMDTVRHVSIRGRYPGFLAVPDRWISWLPGAILVGLRAIRRFNPSVIWSTYPIASSLIIGRVLSRLTGIPWVADFRDPMVEKDERTGQNYPLDSRVRRSRLRIEESCVKRAAALVFCTDSARDICRVRYGDHEHSRYHVIPNGFEESSFSRAESLLRPPLSDSVARPFRLLHSGTVYPSADRDPAPLFRAIAELKREGTVSSATLRITLRATGHDEAMRKLLIDNSVEDLVEVAPPLPYTEALAELMQVDGLLVLQGYPSNPAIPAKLYEYLRAGTPILALVDPSGSTARQLDLLQTGIQASIEDTASIKSGLTEFLDKVGNGDYPTARADQVAKYSRSALTGQLAHIFNAIAT